MSRQQKAPLEYPSTALHSHTRQIVLFFSVMLAKRLRSSADNTDLLGLARVRRVCSSTPPNGESCAKQRASCYQTYRVLAMSAFLPRNPRLCQSDPKRLVHADIRMQVVFFEHSCTQIEQGPVLAILTYTKSQTCYRMTSTSTVLRNCDITAEVIEEADEEELTCLN